MVSAVLFPLYSDGVGAFFPIDYIYIYITSVNVVVIVFLQIILMASLKISNPKTADT